MVVFSVAVSLKHSVRASIGRIVGALFAKHFVILYLIIALYLLPLIFLLSELGLWDLKEFFLWLITVGLVLVFEINRAKNIQYFKKILVEGLTVTALLEFLINFYNFNIWLELFILPGILFISMVQIVAEREKRTEQVGRIFNNLLSIIGLSFVGFSIFKTIEHYKIFFTYDTLNSFIFPVVLTTTFIPLVYLLALYICYDSFFRNLGHRIGDVKTLKRVKKLVVRHAHVNLDRLNRIIQNIEVSEVEQHDDLSNYIRNISV